VSLIPTRLRSDTATFLRLAERSKAPARGNSASDGPFFRHDDSALIQHIGAGGNVGRVLRDDLVALDIDSRQLLDLVDDRLPDTFEIESGGTGVGFHRYYRVPEFGGNQVEFKDDGTEIGGLRSGNSYCLIPPSEHDETGNQYSVSADREIVALSLETVESLISEVKEKTRQHQPAGGGGGGGVGGEIPELPEEYPEKPGDWQTAKRWLASNQLLDRLNRTSSNDWSGLEFSVAKCLAEAGFKESVIFGVLDRLHSSSKWHSRGDDYRKRTVRKAVVAACNDEYVDFSSGDMGASEASESRKTEESGKGRTLRGGENQMDYNDKKTLTAYQANSPEDAEDGDRVVRVQLTNMNGTGDDGEPVDVDLVSIQKGILRENGDFGVSPEFSGDTKRLGAAEPEDLRLMADGLTQLANEIDG